jgi:hypothetical protein
LIAVSLARSAQESSELVACFRHEGEECPRCDGSGFRPRKQCEGCGEHRSLKRNPADGLMYCLECNPRFVGADRALSVLDGMGG